MRERRYAPIGYGVAPGVEIDLGSLASGDVLSYNGTEWTAVTTLSGDYTFSGQAVFTTNLDTTNDIATVSLQAAAPGLEFIHTGAAASNQRWLNYIDSSGDWHVGVLPDSGAGFNEAITILRTGTTVDEVRVRNGAVLSVYDSGETDAITFYHDDSEGYVAVTAGGLRLETANSVIYAQDDNGGDCSFRIYEGGGTVFHEVRPISTVYTRQVSSGASHMTFGPENPGSVTTAQGLPGASVDHTLIFESTSANDIVSVCAYAYDGTDNYRTTIFSDTESGYAGVSVAYTANEPQIGMYKSGSAMLYFAADDDPYFPGHGTTASAANAFLNSSTGELMRSTSSRRYKTAIRNMSTEDAYWALSLQAVRYKSLGNHDDPEEDHVGLIAEDVAAVPGCEELVEYGPAGGPLRRTTEYSYEPEMRYEEVIDPVTGRKEGRDVPTGRVIPTAHRVDIPRDETLVPDAVRYDRVAVMLLEVVKDLHSRVTELEGGTSVRPTGPEVNPGSP